MSTFEGAVLGEGMIKQTTDVILSPTGKEQEERYCLTKVMKQT